MASPIDAATGVDPWSGALLSAGSNVLGKALSPASAPSKADAANTAIFDNSGWAINFGSGSLDATSSKLPQMGGGVNTSMIIWAVVGLVAWKIWNKKSK